MLFLHCSSQAKWAYWLSASIFEANGIWWGKPDHAIRALFVRLIACLHQLRQKLFEYILSFEWSPSGAASTRLTVWATLWRQWQLFVCACFSGCRRSYLACCYCHEKAPEISPSCQRENLRRQRCRRLPFTFLSARLPVCPSADLLWRRATIAHINCQATFTVNIHAYTHASCVCVYAQGRLLNASTEDKKLLGLSFIYYSVTNYNIIYFPISIKY